MIGRLEMVVLDAADITALSAFYRALAGWQESDNDGGWITLDTPDGWQIGLQAAPDHRPPEWPGQRLPQQAHLELHVPDIDAAADHAVSLGGRVLRRNDAWHTVADPAGHPFDLCGSETVTTPTLAGVMLDVPDARAASTFYAELLGKPLTYEADGVAMLGEDGSQPVMFQRVADYTAPRWPDPAYPQQIHLDVEVPDLDEGERAVLELGATPTGRGGRTFRVYVDPVGKPFCLTLSASS